MFQRILRNRPILIILSAFVCIAFSSASEARKKNPDNYKTKYVGSLKCDGSCHDAYYQAWKNTGHGKSFDLLKPGKRTEAKKKAGLDADKDYTNDPNCLRCHTTGYRQRGGFRPASSKKASFIDPSEPNKEQVGCEMCHTVAGGSEIRKVMKNTRGDFAKADTEKHGQRWDYKNVCKRCHLHPKSPFKPSVDPKYEFNFDERVKNVHKIKDYWTEDNIDQKLENLKDRKKEKGKTEETPLIIEDWKIKQKKKGPKLYLKKSTRPYNKVWNKDRKPFKKKHGKKYKKSKEWKEFLKNREWFKYQEKS
ncbi:MAG: cytochrome C-554 [Candidatus Nitronauta litoralis]|uniref:Cytochrome C-554 n=1 Tax=Candidatus Nitronauta litoralis TaxID=2705533 RepID=A0A7T0BWK2_9BACT|nr:MAG: cytochrome C-554 [Candidatus Nitronauta litoralis]